MAQSLAHVPDILLTPYALYDIVSSGRIDKFDLAIDILEELVFFGSTYHVSIPGGTKLLIAMKLMYVLEQIKRQADSVPMIVEKYFPSKGKHTQENALYRVFLNSLIEEKALQERFFETDYTREFGSEFFNNIKQMTENLVLKIVPISEIVKEMHVDTSYFLDSLNLLSTKRSQKIEDLRSALSLSFNYRDEVPLFHGKLGCSFSQDCSMTQQHQENLKKTICLQQCQNTRVIHHDQVNTSLDNGSEMDEKYKSVALKEYNITREQMKLDVGVQQNFVVFYNNFSSLKPFDECVLKNDKAVNNEGKMELSSGRQNLNVNTCLEMKASKGNENNSVIKDEDRYCCIKAGNDMNYQIKASTYKRTAQNDARREQDKITNENNTTFDECSENSNFNVKCCNKRRIKCAQSLFNLIFDDQKVKFLKLDKCSLADKCKFRKKQLRSKTVQVRNVSSLDVKKFYTSFKKKDNIKDECTNAGALNSAIKTKHSNLGLESPDFHCVKRLKCTERSSEMKTRTSGKRKQIQHRKRYKRGKKLYTSKKKIKNTNCLANESSSESRSIKDDHPESFKRQNNHQTQKSAGCKETSHSEHTLSWKNLPPPNYVNVNGKIEQTKCTGKTTLVEIKDQQDNKVHAFNNFAEKSEEFDSSQRNLEKETNFGIGFESKHQNFELNDTALVQRLKAYTSVMEKEEENLCSDKAFTVNFETTDDQKELSTEESDLDIVIPPSVEASPEYLELDIFEEEVSYLDNKVQKLPDFTRFLRKSDPND